MLAISPTLGLAARPYSARIADVQVTMLASGRDVRAARNWVPRVLSPLYTRPGCHRPLGLRSKKKSAP